MLKNKPAHRQCPHPLTGRISKCQLCEPSNEQNQLPLMVGRSLIKKYSKLVSDSTASSEFNQFVNGLSLSFPGGISQYMIQYMGDPENISKYYDISWIKMQITGLIKRNALSFKPKIMHFHNPTYYILRREYRNWRFSPTKFLNNGSKYQKIVNLVNNSFVQVASGSRSAKKSKKKQKKMVESETRLEIQHLCKNINLMCKKLEKGKSVISKNKSKGKEKLEFIPNQKRIQKKSSTQSKKQLNWKHIVESDVSMIGRKQEMTPTSARKSILNQKEVEQIYGIQKKKQKQKAAENCRQYSSKRAITQQAQIIRDSPVTNAYYAKQTNYTEAAGPIKYSKSRSKIKSYGSLPVKKQDRKCMSPKSITSSKSGKKMVMLKDKVKSK